MDGKQPSFTYQEDLDKASEVIRQGGIILYPTDTIWGIGCDARNSEAVKRIFQLKKRADSKSMLTLVGKESDLNRYVEEVPEIAFQLMDVAVKPLTIIYDKAYGVAKELLAEDGSLGIRVTKERFSRDLCNKVRGPLVSTSANISGASAPGNFTEISDEIKEGVDYIVNYRREDFSKSSPSNIIKLGTDASVKIIR